MQASELFALYDPEPVRLCSVEHMQALHNKDMRKSRLVRKTSLRRLRVSYSMIGGFTAGQLGFYTGGYLTLMGKATDVRGVPFGRCMPRRMIVDQLDRGFERTNTMAILYRKNPA